MSSVDRPAPPKTRRFRDVLLSAFVDEVQAFLRRVHGADVVWGRAVEVDFTAAGTATLVVHGLSRRPTGYSVVRRDANFTVFDAVPPDGTDDPRQLWLQASAPGTATLWIF